MAEVLYENRFSSPADLDGWVMEGDGKVSTGPDGLEYQAFRTVEGQLEAHCMYWCPIEFPPGIEVEWDFTPLAADGLCMVFFAASGIGGEDLFDASLPPRDGFYNRYFDGAINAFHLSYYRRTGDEPMNLSVLRKSKGFHAVSTQADPIPDLGRGQPPYRMRLHVSRGSVEFFIGDLRIHAFDDDGATYGPRLGPGKLGFRQMAPMVGRYENLRVRSLAA